MSTLIQERRDMEAKFQEDMMAKKEEFARCLEDIRDADGEEYNNLKVRLESDMQTLEQHHATMQAMDVLNSVIFHGRNDVISETQMFFQFSCFIGKLVIYYVAGSLSIQCRKIGIQPSGTG